MTYVTAKRLIDTLKKHFERFDIPLSIERNIIPEDKSTLFICSGMQKHRERFRHPDFQHLGSVQSCIRTNDLELIGDDSHLSSFEMLGHFSFGRDDYDKAVLLWHEIVLDLGLPITHVTVHPSRLDHRKLWASLGYQTVFDPDCSWSDGVIGGECCELFVGDLEVGNLVNPLGHSVDVGFGLERILQVLEGKERIYECSVFRQDLPPLLRDHSRTLLLMRENGLSPGPKGRESVCRRLVQRCLRGCPESLDGVPELRDWWTEEGELMAERLQRGRRRWRKFRDRSFQFWSESFGLTREDWESLKREDEKL